MKGRFSDCQNIYLKGFKVSCDTCMQQLSVYVYLKALAFVAEMEEALKEIEKNGDKFNNKYLATF